MARASVVCDSVAVDAYVIADLSRRMLCFRISVNCIPKICVTHTAKIAINAISAILIRCISTCRCNVKIDLNANVSKVSRKRCIARSVVINKQSILTRCRIAICNRELVCVGWISDGMLYSLVKRYGVVRAFGETHKLSATRKEPQTIVSVFSDIGVVTVTKIYVPSDGYTNVTLVYR